MSGDVSDPDSYEFDITITAEENGRLVPIPERLCMHYLTAACYRILAKGDKHRLNMMMAKVVRERVTEAEWTLAALSIP